MSKALVFVASILSLVCCKRVSDKTGKNIQDSKTYTTPVGDKIVFLDGYYKDYLKAVRNDYTHKDSLCKSIIDLPIYRKYFSKGEYMMYDSVSFVIKDTTGLEGSINGIEAKQDEMVSVITDALTKSRTLLKDDSITICIAPSNADIKETIKFMDGVIAWTLGSKLICIVIDPNIVKLPVTLASCIAHEFNHAYWCKTYYNSSFQWTLLNNLISEGRADSYAHLLYPDAKCPWDSALTEQDKIALWKRIQPLLQKVDHSVYSEVMFGSTKDTAGSFPISGGYTLGYSIVQSAIKNFPKLSPKELSALSADSILELSDYKTGQ